MRQERRRGTLENHTHEYVHLNELSTGYGIKCTHTHTHTETITDNDDDGNDSEIDDGKVDDAAAHTATQTDPHR